MNIVKFNKRITRKEENHRLQAIMKIEDILLNTDIEWQIVYNPDDDSYVIIVGAEPLG